MKLFLTLNLALICFLTFSGASTAQARVENRGREVGNGGDSIVLAFRTIAMSIASDIASGTIANFPELTAQELKQTIDTTQIVVVEKAFLEGIEKDAINYPSEKLIELSRSRWLDLNPASVQTKALVLHEYLGIMGVSDSNYEVSGRLLLSSRDVPQLNRFDLWGRFVIVDQSAFGTQAMVLIDHHDKIEIHGTVSGLQIDCRGQGLFDEMKQMFFSQLDCESLGLGQIDLNYSMTDVPEFLRGGLTAAHMTFDLDSMKTGMSEHLFQGDVDSKKMADIPSKF